MADIAHIAGLIAAGLHPNPVPFCDVVTSTTHKTLTGPRAGLIMCRKEYARAIDRAVFPGMQGGPLAHVVAAKAVCLRIARSEEFRRLQRQIVANAAALAESLADGGLRLVSGGTDVHLALVDLRGTGLNGLECQELLESVNITANRNVVPFDESAMDVASGLRVGSPAVSTRGFTEVEMRQTARLILRAMAAAGSRPCSRRSARRSSICSRPSRSTSSSRRRLRALRARAAGAEPQARQRVGLRPGPSGLSSRPPRARCTERRTCRRPRC